MSCTGAENFAVRRSRSTDPGNHLDLDGGIQGESDRTDCGTSVSSSISEDLEQQLACTVRDRRLSIETGLALDEDTDANDLCDILETAIQLRRKDRERIQDGKSGRTRSVLERHLVGDPPAGGQGTIHEGKLAAHEDQVTCPDRRYVGGNGSRSCGKGKPKGTQAFFRSHWTGSISPGQR